MIIITFLSRSIQLTLRAYQRNMDKTKQVNARLNRREFEKNRLRKRNIKHRSRNKNRNNYGTT